MTQDVKDVEDVTPEQESLKGLTSSQMAEQLRKEQIAENRRQGIAKAREAKAALKELNPVVKKAGGDFIFDESYHDYMNYVAGLKLGISQLDLRSPAEMKRAIPFAEAFLEMCQAQYPNYD